MAPEEDAGSFSGAIRFFAFASKNIEKPSYLTKISSEPFFTQMTIVRSNYL